MTDAPIKCNDLDELLYHWSAVVRSAHRSGNEWAVGFAASIARQARRRHWRPSPKQAELMRRMVSETRRDADLFTAETQDVYPDDFDVLET